MKISLNLQKTSGARAQAMVEFALVLMILMMVLVGILEVGRLMFFYAAINNASREAARYASAIGLDTNPDNGITAEKYRFCKMIEKAAERSAFFITPTINISYDHGPNTSSFDTCSPDPTTGVDTSVSINSGTNLDRVYVTVSANYSPMLNLLPISSRTIASSSARTIMGFLDLEDLPTRTPIPPTSSVPTTPGTPVPSDTPTATATAPSVTPTATREGEVVTMTPLPSNTPTLIPSSTPTGTLTPLPTETLTSTPTFTPTMTSTAVTGCEAITAGSISFGSNTMSMTITNPNSYDVIVEDVQVSWNAATGGTGSETLSLVSASLGGVFWTGHNSTGNVTILATGLTIAGNGDTSTIVFSFDYDYENLNGNESIRINLSTPGCEKFPIQKP